MIDIVSEKILANLPGGKYSRWSVGLSTEYLELLLWVVGVYGDEYNKAKIGAGINPTHALNCYHRVERMFIALDKISVIQAGGDIEESFLFFSDLGSGPAFSELFRERLAKSNSHEKWAANLNERQLYILLWQVGEHGIRVNLWRGGDYPYAFDLAPQREDIMQSALQVLVAIYGRNVIDVSAAKNKVLCTV